jgi:hypothetical protein
MARLVPGEVRRLAEYFDGDLKQAYAFTRRVWLPDAVSSMEGLRTAVRGFDKDRALFVCDHLREGARTIGAATVIDRLGRIEEFLRNGQWLVALEQIRTLQIHVSGIAHWLERRVS